MKSIFADCISCPFEIDVFICVSGSAAVDLPRIVRNSAGRYLVP